MGGIGLAGRGLGREPLVDVGMGRQHEVGAVLVQGVPEGSHLGAVAVGGVGDEPGVVPVGERALVPVSGEVGPEPAFLLGPLGAAYLGAVGVEDGDVPAAGVVAVPALALRARGRAEVVEIAGGSGGEEFVVADGRAGAPFEAPPGRGVAGAELLGCAGVVDVVPEGEHRPRRRPDQGGRGRRA